MCDQNRLVTTNIRINRTNLNSMLYVKLCIGGSTAIGVIPIYDEEVKESFWVKPRVIWLKDSKKLSSLKRANSIGTFHPFMSTQIPLDRSLSRWKDAKNEFDMPICCVSQKRAWRHRAICKHWNESQSIRFSRQGMNSFQVGLHSPMERNRCWSSMEPSAKVPIYRYSFVNRSMYILCNTPFLSSSIWTLPLWIASIHSSLKLSLRNTKIPSTNWKKEICITTKSSAISYSS